MPLGDPDGPDVRHRSRMQRKRDVVAARIAASDQDRGVIVLHTGNGKGKSSAAFGMVCRALGHGMTVGVVQFIKGTRATGEKLFFDRFPDAVHFHVLGEGFTWDTQDQELDVAAVDQAWRRAEALLTDAAIALVVLDELNVALKYRYLAADRVVAALGSRPAHQHVVITGRGAPPELIDAADTVTRMESVKHAFQAGIKAQKGIEL